jgi:hypothetical protein
MAAAGRRRAVVGDGRRAGGCAAARMHASRVVATGGASVRIVIQAVAEELSADTVARLTARSQPLRRLPVPTRHALGQAEPRQPRAPRATSSSFLPS